MALAQIGWSLSSYGRKHIFSTTTINNHYFSYREGGTTNNFYFLLPPTTTSNNGTITNHSSLALSLPSLPYTSSLEDIMSLPSKWFVTAEASASHQTHTIVKEQIEQNPRTFVAIVMCIRSKPEWKNINQTSLHTLLIPSIEKTVTPDEWKTYRIELFLGFDIGDTFWENAQHRQWLQSAAAHRQPQLGFNFLAIRKQRPSQIPFNVACRAAYELGSDYIVRINDDTEFLTPGWISQGTKQLTQFHPSNLGVVGPRCDQGNTIILTHDMVHRLHLDIFGMEYYPDEFDNWWIDDWISKVYGEHNTKRIVEWKVHHHTNKHGTRYKVDEGQRQHLQTTLQQGKQTIAKYMHAHVAGDVGIPKGNITVQVLGSNRIPYAWGTSVDPIYNS